MISIQQASLERIIIKINSFNEGLNAETINKLTSSF